MNLREQLREIASETMNLLTAQGELEERVRKNKKKLVDLWHEVDDKLDEQQLTDPKKNIDNSS